jgi:hypothetical protein
MPPIAAPTWFKVTGSPTPTLLPSSGNVLPGETFVEIPRELLKFAEE